MSLRQFSYKNEPSNLFDLIDSDDMFIVKLRVPKDVESVLINEHNLYEFKNVLKIKYSFPESFAYIFHIESDYARHVRQEIKNKVNKLKSSSLEYIGTVKVLSGSNIFQIYTGNLFIKFYDSVSESIIEYFRLKYSFSKKMAVHFSHNVFFWESVESLGKDIFDVALEVLQNPEVEYCHPEMVVKSRNSLESNDSKYRKYSGDRNLWIFDRTKIFDAWKYSKGEGVKICVIDDGLDFDHPAFKGKDKIIFPKDMHDKAGKRLPYHWINEKHGTAVSSIAVSSDPNILGVAPASMIIPVRATSLGSILQSEAFYWAAENEADIISCSWGPPDGSIVDLNDNDFVYPIPPHADLAIKYAAQFGRKGKGCMIFFAAGNGGEPLKNDQYASHPDVLAIGSTNIKDEVAVYSDYGSPIFCCFPSGDYELNKTGLVKNDYGVTVADRIGTDGYSDSEYYQYFDGTSASCPGVAGIAALALSVNPNLSRNQLKEVLKKSCWRPGPNQEYENDYSQNYGYGIIDAELAIENSRKTLNKNIMKAASLHIGINKVDSKYYGDNIPELFGCINDKNSLMKMAETLNYQTTSLENEQATKETIKEKIIQLGNEIDKEGILLVTYAGHGAPLSQEFGKTNDTEGSGKDQAWVTYNGFLIDDELNDCLRELPDGLRVVLISDSCYSGSISRDAKASNFSRKRSIPFETVLKVLKNNESSVSQLKGDRSVKVKKDLKATVIVLSACSDTQPALESNNEGLYTSTLTKTYQELKVGDVFRVNYKKMQDIILKKIEGVQQPVYFRDGPENTKFEDQFPFSNESNEQNTEINNVSTASTNQNTPRKKEHRKLIIHEKAGVTTSVNSELLSPQIQGLGRSFDARLLEGKKEWDRAYLLAQEHGSFVEPDIASNIFNAVEEDTLRSPKEYLSTYPNPEEFGSPNKFIWHLDNEHSQLLKAREEVYPELKIGTKPDFSNQVRIAHIDTGYLENSPILPENLQKGFSHQYILGQGFDGANDYDIPLFPAEQQGHGTGTLAILAGGYVDMKGVYQGYYGAIPFAKVYSIKISESVALLSGRNFAAAIDYAIENKCDVITMSMAGIPTKIMADAVNRAYDAGIVVVSAASNCFAKGFGKVLPKVTLYPARFDRVIGAVGACINDVPYLIEYQRKFRAAGGLYMQTCYGPEEALPTSLAAYTPNIVWFNGNFEEGEPLYVKTGGGTSSATPQIAAAAALYIQKYKSELAEISKTEKWKKAEIVRRALFESANKNTQFNHVYGQGILKASDALAKSPDSFGNLQPARPAEVSGNIFKRIFRLLTNRSVGEDTRSNLGNMLELEITQLLHRDANLHKYLEEISLMEDSENYGNWNNLVNDIKASSYASDFLLKSLNTSMVKQSDSDTNRGESKSSLNNYQINSKRGTYSILAQGIQCRFENIRIDQKIEGLTNIWMDEIQLELTESTARGNTLQSLDLIPNDDTHQTAVMIENELDGKKYYEWCFVAEDSTTQTRGIGEPAKVGESISLKIGLSEIEGKRGLLGGGKKVLMKVFKWLRPKATQKVGEKLTEKALEAFYDTLADSKYELLAYDFTEDRWTKAGSLKNTKENILLVLPGLLSTIEKGFDEFLTNPKVKEALTSYKVVGFNMPTLIHGIEDNAKNLVEHLSKAGLDGKNINILARSRGGVVARYLKEKLAYQCIQKIVMVGTPNEGTDIANSENWSKLINIATNVTSFALGTVVPILPKVLSILQAIANHVVNLPGIDDLEPNSDLMKSMNVQGLNTQDYYVVISNFNPDSWLAKVFNKLAVDQLIFKGKPNDTVVPTSSGVFMLTNSGVILNIQNQLVIGSYEGINHFEYLKPENEQILNWIFNKL